MMKIMFKYQWNYHEPVYGHPPYLVTAIKLIDASADVELMYQQYLLSALGTDFPRQQFCDIVLESIEKLEQGELKIDTWDGDGFQHTLTRDTVTFEHSIFGECQEWPIWSCPLSHYKVALLGWRRFLDMPKAIDTELIVELP